MTTAEMHARIDELERCVETLIDAGEAMRHARPNSVRAWIQTANHAVVTAGGKVSAGAKAEEKE